MKTNKLTLIGMSLGIAGFIIGLVQDSFKDKQVREEIDEMIEAKLKEREEA